MPLMVGLFPNYRLIGHSSGVPDWPDILHSPLMEMPVRLNENHRTRDGAVWTQYFPTHLMAGNPYKDIGTDLSARRHAPGFNAADGNVLAMPRWICEGFPGNQETEGMTIQQREAEGLYGLRRNEKCS